MEDNGRGGRTELKAGDLEVLTEKGRWYARFEVINEFIRRHDKLRSNPNLLSPVYLNRFETQSGRILSVEECK